MPSHFVGSPDHARGTGLLESVLTDVGVGERLLLLWTEPVAASAEALAAFSEAYTDPVSTTALTFRWPTSSRGYGACSVRSPICGSS
jgi:hypothetical protein